MTSQVPGFDDWLTAALTEEAAIAGEPVNVFIARSVIARLQQERTSRGDARLEEFLAKIADFGLAVPTPPSSVINDPERLRVLYDTQLLDAESEAAYDRIVQIAAEALGVPAAAVSLVDRNRQFFTSAVGLSPKLAAVRETPLEHAICQSVVEAGEPVIVEDARLHPTLKDHLAVVEDLLVAYAGFPLTDHHGHTVGTLCVWDMQPRQWSSGHVQILHDLAEVVRRRMFDAQT